MATDQATTGGATGKKILIVEDDDLLSSVYLRRLELEGFATKRVNNGRDAQAEAAKYQPDLILLDLMLPGKYGLEVLDSLRKAEETKRIKIFVFSAIAEQGLDRMYDQDRKRMLEAGADEYLVKSRDLFDEVIAKIKGALGVAA